MVKLLDTFDETKVFNDLLPFYQNKKTLSSSDKEALLNYSAVSFDLIGLLGLLTHNMPRILIGKLCTHPFIKKSCREIKHSLEDLEAIADIYMEEEHTEADEFVFRNVMLKYPRGKVDDNGNLIRD